MELMNSNQIADWAGRVAQIARETILTMPKVKVRMREKFFIGMMLRQELLLLDMQSLLNLNPSGSFSSALILSRCILDDFIIVLYLHSKGYDNEEIVKHTASAYKHLFQMAKDGDRINDKYFEGKKEVFSKSEYGVSQRLAFESNKANDQFYENLTERKFKYFPTTADLVRNLTVNAVSAANAGALNLWQYYSRFVHYSLLTEPIEGFEERRKFQIAQQRIVLMYAYKTMYFCSQALNQYGVVNKIIDPTNILPDLMKDSVELSDVDIKSITNP